MMRGLGPAGGVAFRWLLSVGTVGWTLHSFVTGMRFGWFFAGGMAIWFLAMAVALLADRAAERRAARARPIPPRLRELAAQEARRSADAAPHAALLLIGHVALVYLAFRSGHNVGGALLAATGVASWLWVRSMRKSRGLRRRPAQIS